MPVSPARGECLPAVRSPGPPPAGPTSPHSGPAPGAGNLRGPTSATPAAQPAPRRAPTSKRRGHGRMTGPPRQSRWQPARRSPRAPGTSPATPGRRLAPDPGALRGDGRPGPPRGRGRSLRLRPPRSNTPSAPPARVTEAPGVPPPGRAAPRPCAAGGAPTGPPPARAPAWPIRRGRRTARPRPPGPTRSCRPPGSARHRPARERPLPRWRRSTGEPPAAAGPGRRSRPRTAPPHRPAAPGWHA